MKFRKLIEFGKSSYVISIPKYWVIKYELKKGDLLYLTETDDGLMVYPKEKKKIKELKRYSISADNTDPYMLQAQIISAYQSNCGIIEVKGKAVGEHAKRLKELVHNLSGLEVMELTDNKLLARDLLKIEDVSVSSLVRRIDIILRSMYKDAFLAPAPKGSESLIHRDFDINRLVFLVRKVLRCAMDDHTVMHTLKLNNRLILRNWQMVGYLEGLGDELKRIARLFTETNPKEALLPKLKNSVAELGERYLDIMKSHHTKTKDAAFKIDLTYRERMKDLEKLLEKKADPTVVQIIFHLKYVNHIIKNMARTVMDYDLSGKDA